MDVRVTRPAAAGGRSPVQKVEGEDPHTPPVLSTPPFGISGFFREFQRKIYRLS